MKSPILSLVDHIAGVAFAIAPEKADAFLEIKNKHKFHLRFISEAGFFVRVNTGSGRISLSVPTLEYLWCCAYAFFVLSQEYVFAQERGDTHFEMEPDSRAGLGDKVLYWAMDNLKKPAVWPKSFPRPLPGSNTESDSDIATEIFLCAVAWIIQHEVAHVVHGDGFVHQSYSVREEKSADIAAVRWVLDGIDDQLVKQKRTLGIVAALLSLQFLERPGYSDPYIRTHPKSVERLDYCLEEAETGNDDSVVCFTAVGLQYHLGLWGINAPLNGATARDVLRDFMIAFVQGGGR